MQQQDEFVQEHTFYPFARGTLVTATEAQFSTAVEAVSTTEVTVESVTCDPGGTGLLEELKFYLAASYKSDSTVKDVKIVWDAKSTDATTWVELATYTHDNPDKTYVEYNFAGYKGPVTNLMRVPINIRLNMASEDTTHCDGRTKNSSYVTMKWRPSTQG